MKKLLLFVVLLFNILILSGCEVIVNINKTTTTKKSETTTQVVNPSSTSSETTTKPSTTTTTKPVETTTTSPYKSGYNFDQEKHWKESKDETDTAHYEEAEHSIIEYSSFDIINDESVITLTLACSVCNYEKEMVLHFNEPSYVLKSNMEYQAVTVVVTHIGNNEITLKNFDGAEGEIVLKGVSNLSTQDIRLYDTVKAWGHVVKDGENKYFDYAKIETVLPTQILVFSTIQIDINGLPQTVTNRSFPLELEIIPGRFFQDKKISKISVNGKEIFPNSNGLYVIELESDVDITIESVLVDK